MNVEFVSYCYVLLHYLVRRLCHRMNVLAVGWTSFTMSTGLMVGMKYATGLDTFWIYQLGIACYWIRRTLIST